MRVVTSNQEAHTHEEERGVRLEVPFAVQCEHAVGIVAAQEVHGRHISPCQRGVNACVCTARVVVDASHTNIRLQTTTRKYPWTISAQPTGHGSAGCITRGGGGSRTSRKQPPHRRAGSGRPYAGAGRNWLQQVLHALVPQILTRGRQAAHGNVSVCLFFFVCRISSCGSYIGASR